MTDVTYCHVKRDGDGSEARTYRNAVVWYPDKLHRFLAGEEKPVEEHR